MAKFVLSIAAECDIETILAHTHEQFGEMARLRYEALLVRAISDIADEPQRAGSHARPELIDGARTYHIFFSRRAVEASLGRVKHPRHFLLYRVRSDGCVEVARVLHDSMDLSQHLPDDYRSSSEFENDPDAM